MTASYKPLLLNNLILAVEIQNQAIFNSYCNFFPHIFSEIVKNNCLYMSKKERKLNKDFENNTLLLSQVIIINILIGLLVIWQFCIRESSITSMYTITL